MTQPRYIKHAAALVAFFAFASWAQAQSAPPARAATLISDTITFDTNTTTLTATGGVEIFFGDTRLRAERIVYNGAENTVRAIGPLILTQSDGNTVILADFAQLSADLQQGILQSARLVLNQQLQIAATEINQSGDRYLQAFQVVASGCQVCADNPVPLWEIRARRVIHDRQDQQIYFENAQLRAFGVPIAYLPRLRLPDPSLDRATGFLTPSVRSFDSIGTYLRIPYFIRMGDSADLTITPWIGSLENATMQMRYRQAFRQGGLEINGAISANEADANAQRGYGFARGDFALARDYVLDFGLQYTSDDGYLETFGFADLEFLNNFLRLSRIRRDGYSAVSASQYSVLRDGADNDLLPTRVVQAERIWRFVPAPLGGGASFTLDAMGAYRASDTPGTTGRDVARLTAGVDWQRTDVLPMGLLASGGVNIHADIANAVDAGAFDGTFHRIAPLVFTQLRYPFMRQGDSGRRYLFEPTLQLIWSDHYGDDIPNEDSILVAFDEANLFSFTRFAGHDARERGLRSNIGATYTVQDPSGWHLGITGGVILRYSDLGQFDTLTGLSGSQSDYLLAIHYTNDDRWRLVNRMIFDTEFSFTSNELSLSRYGNEYDFLAGYTFLEANPAEGRLTDFSELGVNLRYNFADAWDISGGWRYDFSARASVDAGLTMRYVADCITVELSAERRFAQSATVATATEFRLNIELNGFGSNGVRNRGNNRACLR